MFDWWSFVKGYKEIVSLAINTKEMIGAGGIGVLSVAGVLPRVGIIRALTLGWRSRFKTTYPLSVRKSEIRELSESIRVMEKGSYIAVIGGKGNGKSCLIDTTLNRHFGVVKTSVSLFFMCLFYMLQLLLKGNLLYNYFFVSFRFVLFNFYIF